MIEADRVDRVEARQIVAIGREIAVPGDDVERRMIQCGAPQTALELLDHRVWFIAILEPRHRGFDIARIGEAVGADRAEIRQAKQGAVIFADIATRLTVGQRDAKPHPTRDHRDLQGCDIDPAQLGIDRQPPLLGDDQHLAVGGEEGACHVAIGDIAVDADAALFRDVPGAAVARQTVDPVGRRVGQRQRIPAHPVGARRYVVKGRGAEVWCPVVAGERRMLRGRTQAIEPGTAVLAARRGEGGAGKLFGVQAERRALRGVAADRQCASDRLCGMMIGEAGEVGGGAFMHHHYSPSGRATGARAAVSRFVSAPPRYPPAAQASTVITPRRI